MNPFQVQAWSDHVYVFTTINSSDTTTHILYILDTGLSACTIPSSNSFLIGEYQHASLQTFSELSMAPGGHPKTVSLYDLHHSNHLLDPEGSLQQSKWIWWSQISRLHPPLQTPLIVNSNNWCEGCYQAKIASPKQENRRREIILATKYWNWSFDGFKRVIW